MSSAKKRRELNRAIEEHDKAKLSAQFAAGNHSMLNIAESVLAKEIESLTAKVKELEQEDSAVQLLKDKTINSMHDELTTEQSKVKVLTDALETFNKQYPHMVKGYILDALATVKEGK